MANVTIVRERFNAENERYPREESSVRCTRFFAIHRGYPAIRIPAEEAEMPGAEYRRK